MTPRPHFSPKLETPELELPPGKQLGGAIAAAYSPQGDLFVLHQFNPPDVDTSDLDPEDYLPHVARFGPDGAFRDAWGGPEHIPAVGGVPQWPAGCEGIECDAEGNIWIFGYFEGDNAVLKFSQAGDLLLRIGERGKCEGDDDTATLGGPTSCYHDVENREVFVSDGYLNHRVIAFHSDTGEFTRMWGAYGRRPSELSEEEGFGNPVHKVAVGPDGRLYVCDRIKNRVQEFERVPGGAKFLREVEIATGTEYWGSAFDLAFPDGGRYLYVNDGSNIRVWIVDLESFEVVGWSTAYDVAEGEENLARHLNLVHRFCLEPSGDLLLSCPLRGIKRMKYLGVY